MQKKITNSTETYVWFEVFHWNLLHSFGDETYTLGVENTYKSTIMLTVVLCSPPQVIPAIWWVHCELQQMQL